MRRSNLHAAKQSSREIVRKFQDGRYLAGETRKRFASLCISIKALLTASLEIRKGGFLFRSDCQVAPQNEDRPDPCEVKHERATRKDT